MNSISNKPSTALSGRSGLSRKSGGTDSSTGRGSDVQGSGRSSNDILNDFKHRRDNKDNDNGFGNGDGDDDGDWMDDSSDRFSSSLTSQPPVNVSAKNKLSNYYSVNRGSTGSGTGTGSGSGSSGISGCRQGDSGVGSGTAGGAFNNIHRGFSTTIQSLKRQSSSYDSGTAWLYGDDIDDDDVVDVTNDGGLTGGTTTTRINRGNDFNSKHTRFDDHSDWALSPTKKSAGSSDFNSNFNSSSAATSTSSDAFGLAKAMELSLLPSSSGGVGLRGKYEGMRNLGNTCYIASVMQVTSTRKQGMNFTFGC
jgi:hypothetical protein